MSIYVYKYVFRYTIWRYLIVSDKVWKTLYASILTLVTLGTKRDA